MYFTKAQLRAIWFIIIVFSGAVIYQYARVIFFSDEGYDFSAFDSLFIERKNSIVDSEILPDTISPQKYQHLESAQERSVVIQQFPININKATMEELQALPRIGPAMAARIVTYREEFGPFVKKVDLMKVKGIGKKTFSKLQDLITIE
ncbi:MAG: helix-hairpin-helix domain-containing protein [bacterium]|nr:MAG: helix-hairpin-helix domain-containing protein [bacterium]